MAPVLQRQILLRRGFIVLFLALLLCVVSSACSSSSTNGANNIGANDGGTGAGGEGGESNGDGGTHALCGNGSIDPGENCDGANLSGSSCTSLGFDSGTLKCAASCQFDTSACVGAFTPTVVPSRTSCAAPCAVFFDATTTTGMTNNDYVGANFNWDFDSAVVDANGVHDESIGFVVAHAFDVPGTYQVSLRVRDVAGKAGTITTPITVTPMSGPTIYVATTGGSDGNDGTTMAKAVATFAVALTKAGSTGPASILLQRGDAFSLGSGGNIPLTFSGAFRIGAYGPKSSPDPVLTSAFANDGGSPIFIVGNSTDLSLSDLHITATAGAFAAFFLSSSTNTLFERLEINGIGTAATAGQNFYVDLASRGTFVVDANLHDFLGYGLYGNITNQVGVVGASITNFSGGVEGIRLQGGTGATAGQYAMDSYVADTVVSFKDGTFEALTFRGDHKNVVCVGNTVNHYVSFAPQDVTSVTGGANEHVSYVLAEGNTVAYPGDPFDLGFVVIAQHVVVRNNLFVNAFNAVSVNGEGNAGPLPVNWTDDVAVYNNTHYIFPAVGSDAYMNYGLSSVTHAGTTGSVIAENNAFAEGGQNPGCDFFQSDHMSSTETVDHNLIFAPNATGALTNPATGSGGATGDPKFASTDPTASNAFRLSSGSSAMDVGTTVPVYQDFTGALRPLGAGWDMGAFEYAP